MMISDWGKSGGPSPGDCMDGVAKMMKAYATKQAAAGKKLLFIATAGDNFYWNGVTVIDWASVWETPYGVNDNTSPLFGVPWIAVQGNHDLGNSDLYACCPDVAPKANIGGQNYAGQQLNADRNPARPKGTEKYWLPDYNYHYHIAALDLELIMLDKNSVDISGLGGDGPGHAKSQKACGKGNSVEGLAKMTAFLNNVTAGGNALLQERAKTGTASSVVIIQHYPNECGRQIFTDALPEGRSPQVIESMFC